MPKYWSGSCPTGSAGPGCGGWQTHNNHSSLYLLCRFLWLLTPPSVPLKSPIHLSGWVAAKSVRLFVAHQERYHFLAMLGVDPPEKQNLETISGRVLQQKEEDDDEPKSEEESEKKAGDRLLFPEEESHPDQQELNQDGSPLATHGMGL